MIEGLSERDIAARTGGREALAGVRLVTLGDGPGRGLRLLEVTTGGGLAFEIVVDRCFDLGRATFRGIPFAWSSPTGPVAPGLIDPQSEDGLGLFRGYDGLMTTCGLRHTGGATERDAARYGYAARRRTVHPLHGGVFAAPARLIAARADWAAREIVCEAEVRQAAVYGEHLILRRRITAPIGGAAIRVEDEVENAGFVPEPIMLLYHVNFGWPLIDAGARLEAPGARVTVRPEAPPDAGWQDVPAPVAGFAERVWGLDLPVTDGRAAMRLVNPRLLDGRGLAVTVAAAAATLPAFLVWQAFSPGLYALGLEPATNGARGRAAAEAAGEIVVLAPGERRRSAIEIAAGEGRSAA